MAASTTPPRAPTVLVVEDDLTIAGLIGAVLRREGLVTVVAPDGRSALDHLAREAPAAAVLLDLMLPHRNGFALAEAIRADPRWCAVPIGMLTAHARPEDLEKARGLGIAEYLVKPFHPQALAEAVRRLLAERGP